MTNRLYLHTERYRTHTSLHYLQKVSGTESFLASMWHSDTNTVRAPYKIITVEKNQNSLNQLHQCTRVWSGYGTSIGFQQTLGPILPGFSRPSEHLQTSEAQNEALAKASLHRLKHECEFCMHTNLQYIL